MVDQQHILAVKRLDPSYVKCFLVAAALAFLCLVLVLSHLWRNVADSGGELFNKHEWSLVQAMQQRGLHMTSSVTVIPNILGSPNYDAIALPRLDGEGAVVMLSNADGIPRIKAFVGGPIRHICPADYERITSSVRTSRDVDALLRALTMKDCGS